MATDMSLGGGAGFGAGYTPIRFAPLVSLTGPVMAPATPVAPEVVAPMLRLPMMYDMSGYGQGGDDTPQRSDEAFQNLQPIGERMATPEGRAAEFQNLSRAASALISPFTTIPSLALTGRTPMELLQGFFGGGQQRAVEVPIGSQMLSEKAQGGVASIGGIGGAAYNDAVSIALGGGASQEMADAAGRNAAGLVAQGMDPASAVALAFMTALGQVGPEMPGGMPAPGGQTQGLPGLSRNAFDLTAPVAPQAAQTFALGDSSMGVSSTDFGFDPGGGVGAAPSSAAAGMGPGW